MLWVFSLLLFVPHIFAQCTTELCDCALTESCDISDHDTKATINNLYDLIINIKNENNIQQEDIDKQNDDISILKDNDQFLNATLQEQRDSIQQLEKAGNAHGEQIVDLKQVNTEQNSRLTAVENTNADINQKVNALTSRMNDAETTIRNLETRIDTSEGMAAGHIRLRGGSSSREGRVEVLVYGQWGTVCDDSWDNNDATVVCRQLGYITNNAEAKSRAYYGQGSGPIWLDEVQCNGFESFIQRCGHSHLGAHDCSHAEDAGVKCL